MVELYSERLADSDWRYQELLGQLKTMTNALPARRNRQHPERSAGGGPSGEL